MATKKYEVKSSVRLEDGELLAAGAVRPFDQDEEDTRTFLTRGAIVLVPGQEDNDEDSGAGTAPTPAQSANVPPDFDPTAGGSGGGAASPDAQLAQALGEDVAETLAGAGITTVERAKDASNEDLNAIEGVGTKVIRKIRSLP